MEFTIWIQPDSCVKLRSARPASRLSFGVVDREGLLSSDAVHIGYRR